MQHLELAAAEVQHIALLEETRRDGGHHLVVVGIEAFGQLSDHSLGGEHMEVEVVGFPVWAPGFEEPLRVSHVAVGELGWRWFRDEVAAEPVDRELVEETFYYGLVE